MPLALSVLVSDDCTAYFSFRQVVPDIPIGDVLHCAACTPVGHALLCVTASAEKVGRDVDFASPGSTIW